MNPSRASQTEPQHELAVSQTLDVHTMENSYNCISEAQVWKDFKNGDEEAFVYIYEQYFDTLFNYAHRFCKDRDAVKDHIQDMFIDLRKSKNRLSDTDSIKFYLFSSIRRRVIKAESKKSFFVNTEDYQNYDFEIILSPEQKLINSQLDQNVRKILAQNINQLSARQKEAIMHYYYEGFSYDQVSKLMGFSKVKYARILVYRAVKKLKERIHAHGDLGFFFTTFCFLKTFL